MKLRVSEYLLSIFGDMNPVVSAHFKMPSREETLFALLLEMRHDGCARLDKTEEGYAVWMPTLSLMHGCADADASVWAFGEFRLTRAQEKSVRADRRERERRHSKYLAQTGNSR